ncbi:MAG: hypothetical protein NVV72_10130 [Asticcacaulis sp.]|nr:hypothetical protein [Asticcacaulis sp.]
MHIVTFTALADFPALLNAHLRAFPENKNTFEGPIAGCDAAAGDIFVRDILAFETHVFHTKLRAMLENDDPTLNMTPEVELEAGETADATEDVVPSFEAARKRTLSILADLTDDQWGRRATIDGTSITVIGLVHLLSAHDWTQLADLQRRLAACNAP